MKLNIDFFWGEEWQDLRKANKTKQNNKNTKTHMEAGDYKYLSATPA